MMLKQVWTESGREIYHLPFPTDPTSLVLGWDGLLIQYLLSFDQIVFHCPCAVVFVLYKTNLFSAPAIVRDCTIVLRAC